MHELPVVQDIVKIACDEAQKRGFRNLTRITVVVGELSSVVDESVQMYFELIAEDTPCEKAKLVFEHEPAMLRCRKCGNEFPHERSFDCPACGGESVLIKGTGRALYVKSIDGE